MRSIAVPIALASVALSLTSCAALSGILDTPISIQNPVTGEHASVPLGDVIADNAQPVTGFIGSTLGTINPVLGVMASGAAGLLFAGARRKKSTPES